MRHQRNFVGAHVWEKRNENNHNSHFPLFEGLEISILLSSVLFIFFIFFFMENKIIER
jgi:hypothetical protein